MCVNKQMSSGNKEQLCDSITVYIKHDAFETYVEYPGACAVTAGEAIRYTVRDITADMKFKYDVDVVYMRIKPETIRVVRKGDCMYDIANKHTVVNPGDAVYVETIPTMLKSQPQYRKATFKWYLPLALIAIASFIMCRLTHEPVNFFTHQYGLRAMVFWASTAVGWTSLASLICAIVYNFLL